MNCFSYRKSLSKLNSQRNRIEKSYGKQHEQAEREGDEKKKEEILDLVLYELGEIDDDILYLEHRYLTSVAAKLLLPAPPVINEEKGGLWERSKYSGKYHLTSEGIRRLRGDIRKERKERIELLALRISIIIGLIGALIGLVAVIKK